MFPGASVVFEAGETMLSRFDADPYSIYRKLNLYYPFTDLDEWKMANYLITSRLSMKRIDEFLSLQAVSHGMGYLFKLITECSLRQRRCRFPFEQLRNCVHGQNSYHQLHDGTSRSSPPRTKQRSPFTFISVTLSNASNHFSIILFLQTRWISLHSVCSPRASTS